MTVSEFPLAPLNTIQWDNLGFDPIEVNNHVECHFSTETGSWEQPILVSDPYLRLHGLAPALNYGQQIFEGMKAFRTPSGSIQLFRPEQNAARFAQSARYVSIPPVPTDLFLRAVHLAVGMNTEYVPPHGKGAGMYVRPIAFASSPNVGLSLAKTYTFCVYVLPVAPLHGNETVTGANVLVVENLDRAAPLGTGSVKVGGNYGPVLGVIADARKREYNLTLHLDSLSHTLVDEFSTSGFVGVLKDGTKTTIVVSDSAQIVRSVTVDSICEIARSFGWHVERRPIHFSEVPRFTEIYAAGTAAVLVPVKSIEQRSTETKFDFTADYASSNSVFAQLSSLLRGLQQGVVQDQWGWTVQVRKPESLHLGQDVSGNGIENKRENGN